MSQPRTAAACFPAPARLVHALAALLLLAVPVPAAGDDDPATASACVETECGDRCQEAIAVARDATAKYRREAVALADGYVADAFCIGTPGGAMGFHYLNRQLAGDTELDVRTPEVLLYAQRPDGRRVLAGLEYFVPVLSNGVPWTGSQPPAVIDNPAPVLFGRTFNGPMPGHAPGMPWHYDLHVWAWQHNRAGMFALFNPRVTCPQQ